MFNAAITDHGLENSMEKFIPSMTLRSAFPNFLNPDLYGIIKEINIIIQISFTKYTVI